MMSEECLSRGLEPLLSLPQGAGPLLDAPLQAGVQFAQRLLGAAPLRHVAGDGAVVFLALVGKIVDHRLNRKGRAVLAPQRRFEGERAVLLELLPMDRPQLGAEARVDPRDLRAEQFLAPVAEQFAGALVDVAEFSAGIGPDDEVPAMVDRELGHAQHFLRLVAGGRVAQGGEDRLGRPPGQEGDGDVHRADGPVGAEKFL